MNYLQLDSARSITFSFPRYSDNTEELKEGITTEADSSTVDASKVARRPIVPVETSIKYMNSDGKKSLISYMI